MTDGISEIFTTLEPPTMDIGCDEDDDGERIEIHVTIGEADGTTRAAACTLMPDATDVVLADALLRCVRGCAEMRDPGLRRTIDQLAPMR